MPNPEPFCWRDWLSQRSNYHWLLDRVRSRMEKPRRTGCPEDPDVENVLHELARELVAGTISYEHVDDKKLHAFLREAVLNRVRAFWRTRQRKPPGRGWDAEADARTEEHDTQPQDLGGATPTVDRAAAAEQRHLIQDALRHMPEHNHRTAFLLHHVHGWEHGRIADCLGVPLSTINNWVDRGREKFRAAYVQLCSKPDSGPCQSETP